jgi:hypothetical protein
MGSAATPKGWLRRWSPAGGTCYIPWIQGRRQASRLGFTRRLLGLSWSPGSISRAPNGVRTGPPGLPGFGWREKRPECLRSVCAMYADRHLSLRCLTIAFCFDSRYPPKAKTMVIMNALQNGSPSSPSTGSAKRLESPECFRRGESAINICPQALHNFRRW